VVEGGWRLSSLSYKLVGRAGEDDGMGSRAKRGVDGVMDGWLDG